MYLTHHTLDVCSEILSWQRAASGMETHAQLPSLIRIHFQTSLTNERLQGSQGPAGHWSIVLLLLPSLFDRVCLMTGYFSGHLPLFYKNVWHKNESTDSKWLPHCPSFIQKKKKKCEHQKSQEQQIFSHKQTVTEWSQLGRNWAKVKKGAKNAVNDCLKDEAPTGFKVVGHSRNRAFLLIGNFYLAHCVQESLSRKSEAWLQAAKQFPPRFTQRHLRSSRDSIFPPPTALLWEKKKRYLCTFQRLRSSSTSEFPGCKMKFNAQRQQNI